MGNRFASPQYKKSVKGSMSEIAKGRETTFKRCLMSVFIRKNHILPLKIFNFVRPRKDIKIATKATPFPELPKNFVLQTHIAAA